MTVVRTVKKGGGRGREIVAASESEYFGCGVILIVGFWRLRCEFGFFLSMRDFVLGFLLDDSFNTSFADGSRTGRWFCWTDS